MIASTVTEAWLEPQRSIKDHHANAVTYEVHAGCMVPDGAIELAETGVVRIYQRCSIGGASTLLEPRISDDKCDNCQNAANRQYQENRPA